MGSISYPITFLYFFGLLLAFVSERTLGAGPARLLTAVGILLAVVAWAIRAVGASRAVGERRAAERMLLGLYSLGLFAVVLYLLQSDLSAKLAGKPLDQDWPKLATALAALWPALWLFAALPIVMVEFSYAGVVRAPKIEIARVRDALLSGIGLAGAIVFAVAACYVAAERDKKVDLSYFRTAKPGESTRKIVRTIDQPIEAYLFFPPANEVRGEVADYFDSLKKESNLLGVHLYDHDIDLAKAKELSVSGNGIVVLARGAHREQLSLGLELEGARAQLRNLDKDVQQRLLKVAKPARTVYLVTGHGERSFDPSADTDKRGTIRDLRDLMSQQGSTVRTLGAAEGLAQEVPEDASLVMLIGPDKPLLPEESAALVRYFDRGGKLFIALDPESHQTAPELLGPLGLKFIPEVLCSDLAYARKTNQLSDRQNLVTASFSSHPSVTTLSRFGGRAPLIMVGAGHLEELKTPPKGDVVNITVRAHGSTWNDKNGNFTLDPPGEERKAWELAAAVMKPVAPELKKKDDKGKEKKEEGRALVVADSDLFADGIINVQGNPLFVLDGARWLLGDEAIAGEIVSENDVPIVHTKKQDQIWFYGSSFLAPLLVLGIGFLAVGRRGGRKARATEAANGKDKQS